MERGEDGPCKASARGCPKERSHRQLRCSEKSHRPGTGWGLESCHSKGEFCQGYYHSTNKSSSNGHGVNHQTKVTATRKTVGPKKPTLNLQQPQTVWWEDKKERSRERQSRGRQTHNPRPGGLHPKFHLPDRGHL